MTQNFRKKLGILKLLMLIFHLFFLGNKQFFFFLVGSSVSGFKDEASHVLLVKVASAGVHEPPCTSG